MRARNSVVAFSRFAGELVAPIDRFFRGQFTITLKRGAQICFVLAYAAAALLASVTPAFAVNKTDNGITVNVDLPSAQRGVIYSHTISPSGGGGAPYTFVITSGTLPTGLTLSSSGVVSGAVDCDVGNGSYTLDLQITSSTGTVGNFSGSKNFSINVTANPSGTCAVTMGTIATTGSTAANYSSTISASGSTAPYTFALVGGALPPGLSLSSEGAISGLPTTAGTYTFTVQVTSSSAPTVTGTKTYTITIAQATLTLSPTTLPDGTSGVSYTQTVTASGGIGTYAYAVTSGTLPAGLSLNTSTGEISGTPTTSGTYNFTIGATDSNSNIGSQAYTVVIAPAVVSATDDDFSASPIVGASGGSTASVLANDTLNGNAVTVGGGGNVTLTPGTAPAPVAGSITMNADGTVTVAAGTTAGTYNYPYSICEAASPANCDSATASIVVSAALIDAVDDDFSGSPVNGASGGATASVLGNDTLNGSGATTGTVTLSQQSTTSPGVTLNTGTGAIAVAAGTAAGSYTVTYQICEQLNGSNCDTASVTVAVSAAVIDAVSDDFSASPVNGASGGAAASVVANDTLNTGAVTVGGGGNSALTPGVAPAPAAGSIAMNADGTITVAAGTTAGSYSYPYTICENLNPTNCDADSASVVVSAAAINAVDDSPAAINGASGGNTASALGNDTLNGGAATVGGGGNVALTPGAAPTPAAGSITMNADGTITVAAGTTAGSYSYPYTICEQLNPANCDAAIATVSVSAATIDAGDDSPASVNGASGGSTASVLGNDTLSGGAATVGGGGNVTLTPGAAPSPAAGSITMNADGTITVAAGTTAGSYGYSYTICEVLNAANCDTATATVVVSASAIDAVDDTPASINGASGGSTAPVLGNDTLNSAAVTVGGGGNVTLTPGAAPSPAAGSITMNADGTITVAAGTTAGSYSYPYTICEVLNAANCDAASASVVVSAATIDAIDDDFSASPIDGASGGSTGSVLGNDTLNGSGATTGTVTLSQQGTTNPSVTLNTGTGVIDVAAGTSAGSYTVTYQICEQLNGSNCDTASVTVVVSASTIDAVDDSPASINGASGGSTASVLGNDTLDGGAATVGGGGNVALTPGAAPSPAAGSITMNADGTITVAAGTTAGSYGYSYTICEVLSPANCDTATATVAVSASTIDAVDDSPASIDGASGGSTAPVLGNDALNGGAATVGGGGNVSLSPGAAPAPAAGSITMNADGTITIAAGTTAGSYGYPYTICEVLNPANCDTATATVVVSASAIDAVDDTPASVSGASGGSTPTVLGNDTLNGGAATVGGGGNVALTPGAAPAPAAGSITMNADGTISIAAGTTAGSYSYSYSICEILNPANCDAATATVVVSGSAIDAVDDDYSASPIGGASGGNTASVLTNDTLNGGAATVGGGGNITLTPGAAPSPAAGSITMNVDGTITVAAGTTAGSYSYPYTICEQLNPANCDAATATVSVSAAAIDAVDDSPASVNGASGGSTASVLGNDTLNGSGATTGTVTLSQQSTTNAGVTLNTGTGVIDMAAGTPAGSYTVTYQICEQLNGSNCDTATATVGVSAAVIDAVDDVGTVANGATGGDAVPNVLVNDTLNGVPATLATVTLSQVSTTNPNVTLNPATGAVNVAPGTPAGTYAVAYRICEQLNPTNCDTAIVTVTVGAAAIDAVDDTPASVNGTSGGNTATVLGNDALNGGAATVGGGGNVTLTPGAAPTPTAGSITMNADGTITIAAGTTAGSYNYPYTICEVLNPTNCDAASVTIAVTAAVIDAVDDSGTVANGAAGGVAAANVLSNDTLNGSSATLATVTLSQLSTTNPNVTLNPATGAVNVAPGTPAGTYTVTYSICEQASPANCDTASVTVTVGAAAIDAVDDSPASISGATGGSTASVLGNDTLNGGAATVGGGGNVTLTPGAAPTPAAGSITMNADGTITVAAGTTAGSYNYPYTICEVLNPTNCDTATATVSVSAATINAVDDAPAAVSSVSGGSTSTVLGNDTLNGGAATVGGGGNVTLTPGAAPTPAAGSITMNAGGTITVAAGTTPGSYAYPYTICEVLNGANCDAATATIAVSTVSLTLGPASLPDPVNGTGYLQTVTGSGGVGPYTYAVTGGALPDGLTLNPATGEITGTPTGVGPSSFTITVTDSIGNTGTGTYNVTTQPGPSVVITLPDLPDASEDVPYNASVAITGPNGPFTYSLSVGSLPPGLSLDPNTGEITGTPTVPGAFTFTLYVEDSLGNWGTRVFTMNVVARPDPSEDAEVRGLIGSEFDIAGRFAEGQLGTVARHLEAVRGDCGAESLDDSQDAGADEGEDQPAACGSEGLSFWGAVTMEEARDGSYEGGTITGGADWRFSRELVIGVAVSAGFADDTVGTNGSGVDALGESVTGYALYNPFGGLYFEGALGWATLDMGVDRYVTATGDFARSDRTAEVTYGSLGIDYELELGDVRLSPYARYEFVDITLDRSAEGAAGTDNLTYLGSDRRLHSLVTGARVSVDFDTDWGSIAPFIRLEHRARTLGGYEQLIAYSDDLGTLYDLDVAGSSNSVWAMAVGAHANLGAGKLAFELGSSGTDGGIFRDFIFRVEYRVAQ